MAIKKSEATQLEQSLEFQNLKSAMKKILAVSKDELVKREEEYKQTRKQRPRKKETPRARND